MTQYQYVDKGGKLQVLNTDSPTAALSSIQGISDPSSGVITPPIGTVDTGQTEAQRQAAMNAAGLTPEQQAGVRAGTGYSTNPVVDSSSVTNLNDATGVDITELKKAFDAEQLAIDNERAMREKNMNTAVSDIEKNFDEAARVQGESQKRQYAGRATNLVTAGGGFLGATQSHEGVLQNLENTHQQERDALMAKRAAAINEARAAWQEKDFALARQKAQDAKDYQNELYQRQKDFAAQKLQLAQEKRQQEEFQYGITDKKAASYASLPDADYAKISPVEKQAIDKMYFPGYLDNLQMLTQKAKKVTDAKAQTDLETSILDMRLKMPYGTTFQIGGVTYTGLKQDKTSLSATEQKAQTISNLRTLLNGQTVTDKNNAEFGKQIAQVPGSGGVPLIDSSGLYLTEKGWEWLRNNLPEDISLDDFILEFSDKFNPTEVARYNLSPAQRKVINPDYSATGRTTTVTTTVPASK